MKQYLLLLFFIMCIDIVHAQELNVKSFVVKTSDITARTQPRQDINGNDCSLVKVRLAAENASFSGNVVGDVAYDKSEYYVYMPHGSKRLTIKLDGYLPLDVNFEEFGINTLEGKTVYVMTIAGVSSTQQLETPKTKTGWIILDSEPSGASVYINDEFVGNTPLSNYKQAYGTYQYRLESPNYHSATGIIELNAGRFEQKVVLKPAFGSISVKSSIAGAKIVLDGKQTGKQTPATLTEIPSGTHTITLQMDKYAPRQQEVIVEDGQTANVSMTLDARFARITINTLDGTEIYSNGKLLGKGRISEDMMEGYYDIEARLDHHKSVTKQIQVVAGQSQEILLNPIPKYGSLDVMSTPHDAIVEIDGKTIGKSPLSLEKILEGEHQIVVSKDGYEKETKNIFIKEGEMATIATALKKNQLNQLKNKSWEEIMKVIDEYKNNNKDVSDLFEKYKKSANQGDVISQMIVGYMYFEGIGVDWNQAEAAIWFKKASDQKFAPAQYYLGLCYFFGWGLPKNMSESKRLMKLAADQNFSFAQQSLGHDYEEGWGVPKNYEEAARWYRKAADQGEASSQYSLGKFYEEGLGVTQNYEEAVKWYRKSAEQGHSLAQFYLGKMYYKGLGVTLNYEEAAKWWRKSAEQGYDISLYNMGVMYQYGIGVQKDINQAKQWYQKAAEKGNDSAKKALESLRR